MGCGRFVGWVGMFAVALGVGVAAPAVATADSAEGDDTGRSANSTDGTDSSDTSAEDTDAGKTGTANTSTERSTNGSTDSQASVSVGDAPPVVVRSSGGAHSRHRPVTRRAHANDGDKASRGAASPRPHPGRVPVARPSDNHGKAARTDVSSGRATDRPSSPAVSSSTVSNTIVARTPDDSETPGASATASVPAPVTPAAAAPAAQTPVDTEQPLQSPPALAPLRAALLGALGALPVDPSGPVGSPLFDAVVAAYRRTESRQEIEQTTWVTTENALTGIDPDDQDAEILLATTTLAAAAVTDAGAASLDYEVTSDWGSGFVANVTVTAGGSDLDGWTVEFDSPADITNLWSGAIVSHVDDHYVVQNAAWNGTVTAGQTVAFGFEATGDSTSVTGFVVNDDLSSGSTATTVDELGTAA